MAGCLALFIGGVYSGEIRPLPVTEAKDVPRRFSDRYMLGKLVTLPCGCGLAAIYTALDPIPAIRHAHCATASSVSMMVEDTMDLRVAWAKYLRETEIAHVEFHDLEFAADDFRQLVFVMHHKSKLQARLAAKQAHTAGT